MIKFKFVSFNSLLLLQTTFKTKSSINTYHLSILYCYYFQHQFTYMIFLKRFLSILYCYYTGFTTCRLKRNHILSFNSLLLLHGSKIPMDETLFKRLSILYCYYAGAVEIDGKEQVMGFFQFFIVITR